MKTLFRHSLLSLVCSVLVAAVALAQSAPEYTPSPLPVDTLTSVGSDSMGTMMERWIGAYRKAQPNVEVRVSSQGSASAPPALIEGSADLAPMAREMKASEQRGFLTAFGFQPTQVRVAYAAIGVYVAADSPLQEISIEQLRTLFGQSAKPPTWSAVGVAPSSPLASMPVVSLGQIKHSYLAPYFKQKVLLQQPFASQIMETASPQSLFEVLSQNPAAVGFAAVVDKIPAEVKMLPIVETAGRAAVVATAETIADGTYPLSRSLNIYIAREPNEKLEASLEDFLLFVLSKQGQQLVVAEGLLPLTARQLTQERALLQ